MNASGLHIACSTNGRVHDGSITMHRAEWREFLKLYSEEFLSLDWSDTTRLFSSNGAIISDQARRAVWMGYEPASDEAILAAEDRLERRLPPSLRTFYAVSNGWGMINRYIYDVLPVEKIGWLEDLDPHLFGLACKNEDRRNGRPFKKDPDNSRLNWFVMEQGTMVKRSLAISSWGDAARWLLDPGDLNHEGEWTAGAWASWIPGMEWSASSFAELMRHSFEANRARGQK